MQLRRTQLHLYMWFYQDRQYDKIDLSEVEMNGTDEKKDNVFLEVFLCMLAFLLMYLAIVSLYMPHGRSVLVPNSS